jgi:hypothetical protein
MARLEILPLGQSELAAPDPGGDLRRAQDDTGQRSACVAGSSKRRVHQ